MRKIKIYWRTSQVANCGVGYYRQYLALKELEKRNLIELRMHDFNWGESPIKEPYEVIMQENKIVNVTATNEFIENMNWADIVYICRDECTPFLSVHGGIMEEVKKKNKHAVMIADIDDYVQFTRPHNPGYMSFHPGSAFNKLNLKLLQIVDGLTVSTDFLKKVYSKENKKIFVCPNSLDVKWRNEFLDVKPLIKKKKDEIRIGWAGSAAHYENLKLLLRPLKKIMEEYPNVTFHYTGLFGDLFKYEGTVADRIKTVGFANLKEWPKKLKQMGLDIALAPLCDNNFNRAKSNLRVLEYWAAQYPVIASPILPYQFIKDGKDGLLAKEEYDWYEAMKKMIDNIELRNNLRDAGYARLCKEYDIAENCMIWYDAIRKIAKIKD